jgi:lipoprotein-releasing system permease protein
MYKLFLTLRYLTRRPLALVAILALTGSVFVLVIAPSIMNGFQTEFHKRIRGTLSDITISSHRPFAIPEDPRTIEALRKIEGVTAAAPFVENPALDKHLRKIDYCFLRGVVPELEAEVGNFEQYFISERAAYLEVKDLDGAPTQEEKDAILAAAARRPDTVDTKAVFEKLNKGDPDDPGMPTCAVGVFYLVAWNLHIGDTVRLTTATDQGEVNQDREFKIVGAFKTGFSEADRRQVVMSLKTLQEFIGVPGQLSGYSLRTQDYEKAREVKERISQKYHAFMIPGLPDKILVVPWLDRNKNLLQAVAMERLLIRIITFCIVIAAVASIFLVLFMTVHTKIREFGILRAIGGTPHGVLSLFMGQGLLIALLGMASGTVVGIVLSNYINEAAALVKKLTGWHPFPPEVYYLDRIPTRIDPGEIVFNFAVVLGLGAIAAIVPGVLAALRPPLKAIRHD